MIQKVNATHYAATHARIPGNRIREVSTVIRAWNARIRGLLFAGKVCIVSCNTPAMPLYDAHFGGFFASGVCR